MNFFKTHNISTYGGPLVMLPKSDANIWQGCVDLKPEEHYSLACSQHNYLSVLSVEGVQTIILGDEPLRYINKMLVRFLYSEIIGLMMNHTLTLI